MEHTKATYVILSAPSGCGKDTIIKEICKQFEGIGVSVSCTTRPPRPKTGGGFEKHGVDYFFIDREEFEEKLRADGFLEYAEHTGDLYGTPRSYVEKLEREGCDIILMNIENQGAEKIKELYPDSVSIFVLPPSAQELRRRLVERGAETADQIEKRIIKGKEQMKTAYNYDYIVLNDVLAVAVADVAHIIGTVRRRAERHTELIDYVNATYAEN